MENNESEKNNNSTLFLELRSNRNEKASFTEKKSFVLDFKNFKKIDSNSKYKICDYSYNKGGLYLLNKKPYYLKILNESKAINEFISTKMYTLLN